MRTFFADHLDTIIAVAVAIVAMFGFAFSAVRQKAFARPRRMAVQVDLAAQLDQELATLEAELDRAEAGLPYVGSRNPDRTAWLNSWHGDHVAYLSNREPQIPQQFTLLHERLVQRSAASDALRSWADRMRAAAEPMQGNQRDTVAERVRDPEAGLELGKCKAGHALALREFQIADGQTRQLIHSLRRDVHRAGNRNTGIIRSLFGLS